MEKMSNLCVVVAKCRKPAEGEGDNVMTRRPWGG
jgi:hypothetical protein